MNKQNKNPFSENDKSLITAEFLLKLAIPICLILIFITGLVFLFTELFFLGFIIWIFGGVILFVVFLFNSLMLGFFRDVKAIRNKLYGIENEKNTTSTTHVITPENEYMTPYYK